MPMIFYCCISAVNFVIQDTILSRPQTKLLSVIVNGVNPGVACRFMQMRAALKEHGLGDINWRLSNPSGPLINLTDRAMKSRSSKKLKERFKRWPSIYFCLNVETRRSLIKQPFLSHTMRILEAPSRRPILYFPYGPRSFWLNVFKSQFKL